MLYLEQKYVGVLSSRLRNFKRKENLLWNFSCPVCGDSARDKRKARAYIYESKGRLYFHCHNNDEHMSFRDLLKTMDEELYREYLMELFQDKARPSRPLVTESTTEMLAETRVPQGNPLDGLRRVSDLMPPHPAAEIVRARLIPQERWSNLFHADDYPGWARRLVPEKYEDARPEPRLVIPFHDRDGRLIGFQGRAYGQANANIRYLTVCLDKEPAFLYGWDRVDPSQTIIAVEGPIDSMFLPNAVATAGGSIAREIMKAGVDKAQTVVAYDNEPRSPSTVTKMRKAVAAGFPIFIWPQNIRVKDFNDQMKDLVDTGMRPAAALTRLADMVKGNVHTGMAAELKITEWRRCNA